MRHRNQQNQGRVKERPQRGEQGWERGEEYGRYPEREYDLGGYGGGWEQERDWRGRGRQPYEGGYEGRGGHQGGEFGEFQGGGYGGERQFEQFDPDYLQWREEQIRHLDEDYRNWRKERYGRFSEEFNTWRKSRESTRGAEGGTSGTTGASGKERGNK